MRGPVQYAAVRGRTQPGAAGGGRGRSAGTTPLINITSHGSSASASATQIHLLTIKQ